MKIQTSKPFTGFNGYKVFHKKEGRWLVILRDPINKKHTTISHARYLMSVKLGRRLTPNESVDHINNNRVDDRIENLQILTPLENTLKSNVKIIRDFICPICRKPFTRKRNPAIQTPACSRSCGGKLAFFTFLNRIKQQSA